FEMSEKSTLTKLEISDLQKDKKERPIRYEKYNEIRCFDVPSSVSGVGSNDFHLYRKLRRMNMEREIKLEEEYKNEKLVAAQAEHFIDLNAKEKLKTAKKAEKRQQPPMGYGKAGVGKMGIGKSGGKLNYENIALENPILGQQGYIGSDAHRPPAARHPPTGEKIFMSADGIPNTDSALKRKRSETYSAYIYKVLKQVHPETGISNTAMDIMNSFINDILEKISIESNHLAINNDMDKITSREIQTAVRLILPGELAKHAVAEGTKAVTKYTSSSAQM
ncbi:hypothetical protein MHBO_003386, partial [Bonamia ostreae]